MQELYEESKPSTKYYLWVMPSWVTPAGFFQSPVSPCFLQLSKHIFCDCSCPRGSFSDSASFTEHSVVKRAGF